MELWIRLRKRQMMFLRMVWVSKSGSSGMAISCCPATWAGLRPGSPSFSCPTPSSLRHGRCCSTEASLVTAVKTRHTLWCCVLSCDLSTSPRDGRPWRWGRRHEGRHHHVAEHRRWQAQERRALWFSQDSRSQLCQRVECAMVQLDYDEDMGPLHAMCGSMEAEYEVQQTIKRAELTAFLCFVRKQQGYNWWATKRRERMYQAKSRRCRVVV